MDFQTGHFSLFKIYEYVASHPKMHSGKTNEAKAYSNLISELINGIPTKKSGWYLWGRFNDIGWWETIYLGKAGNLSVRLYDELREECIAFWAFVYGKETASKQASKITNGKYDGAIPRCLRKTGTHFIVWISGSELIEDDIKREEKALIERYRPSYNAQRITYPEQTSATKMIIELLDLEIEKIKR